VRLDIANVGATQKLTSSIIKSSQPLNYTFPKTNSNSLLRLFNITCLPVSFQIKLVRVFMFLMLVTCSTHHVRLALLIFIIFGEVPRHYEVPHCEIFSRFLFSLPSYLMTSYNETFLKFEVM
jgi:hypothetical protein